MSVRSNDPAMDAAVERDASVAHRYASAGSDDWTETLARADANDVAIPVLERLLATATGDETRSLDAELRRRRAALETFALDLERVHELLTGAGIEYAVVKTNVGHPYRPWDLNVLARKRDWPRTIDLLEDEGWTRTSFRAHPLARTEPGKRLYEHDVRHPVHLHAAVSWNGLEYLPASSVLDSRRLEDGVFHPDPVVDATIHCAHGVFENFELTLGEALEITNVFGDGATVADRAGGRGIEAGAVDRGRDLAVERGWPEGYELAVDAAREVVARVRREPEAIELPRAYAPSSLLRAWLGHARRTDGGWYELPANAALWGIK